MVLVWQHSYGGQVGEPLFAVPEHNPRHAGKHAASCDSINGKIMAETGARWPLLGKKTWLFLAFG